MIKSFKCRDTEDLFSRIKPRKWPQSLLKPASRKLLIVDAATNISDLRIPPGNHLEKLGGDRKGQHSIRINDQWRICFKWKEEDAHEVEIVKHYQ